MVANRRRAWRVRRKESGGGERGAREANEDDVVVPAAGGLENFGVEGVVQDVVVEAAAVHCIVVYLGYVPPAV